MDYSRRRCAVVERIGGTADGFLSTTPANVRYLTGFSGTNGWLLLLPGEAFFLTDPRYAAQAEQLGGLSVVVSSEGLTAALVAALEARTVDTLGFEPDQVSVSTKSKLDDAFSGAWVAADGTVEGLRRTKDAAELAAIGAAMALTESALGSVVDGLASGWTEAELAAELERACRRAGAESMAFETIVASGPRSALPHGVAGRRRVESGEAVMIDMGCRLDGYCADLTRMVWCGGPASERFLELHDLVDAARAAALAAVRPGTAATDVDAAARDVIVEAGYGEAFRHGTGHGVGLEIHEAPKVSTRSVDTIEEGMVLTIEPGVYFEGELGVRIEDLVRVTADGCERLTTLGTDPILREST